MPSISLRTEQVQKALLQVTLRMIVSLKLSSRQLGFARVSPRDEEACDRSVVCLIVRACRQAQEKLGDQFVNGILVAVMLLKLSSAM